MCVKHAKNWLKEHRQVTSFDYVHLRVINRCKTDTSSGFVCLQRLHCVCVRLLKAVSFKRKHVESESVPLSRVLARSEGSHACLRSVPGHFFGPGRGDGD